ncbi:hypothetical protein F4604DRAFT_2002696 [Suillus subluteus]|nr:hypothetical protein F4604DRAFT_2002696 [Suillus subluteus]
MPTTTTGAPAPQICASIDDLPNECALLPPSTHTSFLSRLSFATSSTKTLPSSSSLHLVLRLRGDMEIFIKTITPERLIVQATQRQSHSFGLQHPEGVHPSSGLASPQRHVDLCEDPHGEHHAGAVDEENYKLHFVTHPELEEDFNKAEEEQREKDKADAEKQAKKKTEDEARHSHTQIECDVKSKMFDALSTLRCKDDFIAVAGALKISRDRTIEELRTRIKEFLADAANQHFANNPRFAALFQTHSKTKNLTTASSTGQASSGSSQDNDATSSNTSGTHFFTPPASAHSFNPYYPPHFTNQPYFHQFYANPALCAPSYSTTQHNNSSGGPIASSSSNLDRQPQHPYNTHSLPTHPPQFYNYGTNHGHPRT